MIWGQDDAPGLEGKTDQMSWSSWVEDIGEGYLCMAQTFISRLVLNPEEMNIWLGLS